MLSDLCPMQAISRETGEDVRLGALECATSLYYTQARAWSPMEHLS